MLGHMSDKKQAVTPKDRIRTAYKNMVHQARYRPAAPGDGFGGVHLTAEQMTAPAILTREATLYAKEFLAEDTRFEIGEPCWDTKEAFVYTIEAARLLCSGSFEVAASLLRMAITEIEALSPKTR
jgi:hypothetical protein